MKRAATQLPPIHPGEILREEFMLPRGLSQNGLARWNDGRDTNQRNHHLITTRPHRETTIARIKREPKFARALYAEAVNCFLDGETAAGLSLLRDLVNAQISFKELARQTGLGEKSLHRMPGRNGNPTAHHLAAILRSMAEDLHVKPRVEVAAA